MTSIKCPRCSAAIEATPDELGFVVCPSCSAKLRSRTPTVVKVQGTTGPAPASPASPAPATDIDSVLARLEAPDPARTLPPGTPLKKIPRPGEPGSPGVPLPAPPSPPLSGPATLETLAEEIRAVRKVQDEILELLRGRSASAGSSSDAGPILEDGTFTPLDEPAIAPAPPPPPPMRSRRRKTVLLIDDDEATRQAAAAALERAQVPVKTAGDGNSGLASIAMEKPDVIVMELDIDGSMPGKDVINMIKATMEWVDIPILLYTRQAIESQKEARTVHGADEFVLKQQGGPDALVNKVITLFRKG